MKKLFFVIIIFLSILFYGTTQESTGYIVLNVSDLEEGIRVLMNYSEKDKVKVTTFRFKKQNSFDGTYLVIKGESKSIYRLAMYFFPQNEPILIQMDQPTINIEAGQIYWWGKIIGKHSGNNKFYINYEPQVDQYINVLNYLIEKYPDEAVKNASRKRILELNSIEYEKKIEILKAIRLGNKQNLDKIESLNFDINTRFEDGRTALMIAASASNLAVVTYLLGKGADINLVDNYGNTALIIGVYNNLYNSYEIVKYLIDEKADVSIKNKNGYTAYDVSLKFCGNKKVTTYLKKSNKSK